MRSPAILACQTALLYAGAFVFTSALSAETIYLSTTHRAVAPNQVAGQLYLVDPTTAEGKLVGAVVAENGVSVGVTGMAVNPATGILYGITAGFSSPPSLVTINPKNAEAKTVGALGYTSSDISFDRKGRLFAWLSERQRLASVDLTTGAATPVGPVISTAETTGGGLAIDDKDVAYIIPGTAAGTLDTINLATMQSSVGPVLTGAPFLSSINSLTFSPKGRLYGVNSNMAAPAKTALVVINRDTGVVTKMGDLQEDADGLTFSQDVAAASVAQGGSPWRLFEIALLAFAAGAAGTYKFMQRRLLAARASPSGGAHP
jgi:hypothetical protein